jgi:Ca2+-binding EF-hand superfamily protein
MNPPRRLGDLLVYEALHQYDTDHDGLISASELRILLAEYKKRYWTGRCLLLGGESLEKAGVLNPFSAKNPK